MEKKSSKNKTVKFLLAPRPQKDPLTADYEAPQNVLIPKDGVDIDQIRNELPDFDPSVFVSKKETKLGMLERAHNADGITFDPDLLEAMSKDFNYEDPNNVLDDDFMDQAGGLIEDEGEMLDGEMTDLAADLFSDEPELVTFGDDEDDDDIDREGEENGSYDSDEFDIDQQLQAAKKPENNSGEGRKLILLKRRAKKTSEALSKEESARKLQEELNRHFNPENQKLLAMRSLMLAKKLNGEDPSDFGDDDDDQDDTKTIFTNYSMTSSVMRRNQGLQQIDEHFEKLYEKEYADDTEIGPLDLNEVKGDELLTNIDQIKEMKKEIKIVQQRNHGDNYVPEIVSDHHKNAIIGDDPGAEDEDLVEIEIKRRENRVDCESILTYNSNLYNHPKLIVEPRKRNSSRATVDQMETESDARSRSNCGQSIASSRATVLSRLSQRPVNETPQDRKARKKALKAYRHERRQERKQNQQIFKTEQANIMKQQRSNLTALKLS